LADGRPVPLIPGPALADPPAMAFIVQLLLYLHGSSTES
jgi:hypothetical protein